MQNLVIAAVAALARSTASSPSIKPASAPPASRGAATAATFWPRVRTRSCASSACSTPSLPARRWRRRRGAPGRAASTDLESLLPKIKAPALIVWGSDDPIWPRATANEYARRIRGARIAIDHAGHAPYLERPAPFVDIVLPFTAK